MTRRRAKSSITRLPAEQKAYVERLLREGRLTLDEMIAELQGAFPGAPAAELSRSALHRYDRGLAELTARMREIDQAAQALVGEMGDGIGEKSGALLAQAVTTLATDAALKMQTQEKVSVDEVRKMARAAKDAIDTQRVGINVRKAIAAEAREQLLREQAANLDKVVKSGGLSEDAAAAMRRQILGIAS
ncbi:DUF3486 family protein [Xanthomonas melonis]|uniref:phage protein Gp27 family protein n=1 Tax=Xanthomonas melonis TaxID=56456 RepID=UPI001E3DB13C|nr:phage protein Gp27 family protein [Xanthomonas melonis]MCD0281302.1 DUF3486 family protein [Xanthomonas melonis]